MFYLIGQIALTLFFTALIGLTMGWLLRGLGTSRQTDAIEARWRAQVARLQQRDAGAADNATDTGAAQTDPAADRTIAELRRQVKQRDDALEGLRAAKTMRPDKNTDTQSLAAQLRESTELCSQLQGHLAEQLSATDQLKAQLERAAPEREMLIERLRDRETEIGRMSQERQHAINTIASLQKEVRTMRGERSRETEAARSAGQTTADSDTPPAIPTSSKPARPPTATAAPASSQPRPEASADAAAEPAVTETARQQNLPIDTGKSASKPRYQPDWLLSAPDGPKDNLQAIFGIGPKLEHQLNALGIFHYEQIGRFQKDDILWVAHHLKSFPGRIVRDRWIQQAQTLANERRS